LSGSEQTAGFADAVTDEIVVERDALCLAERTAELKRFIPHKAATVVSLIFSAKCEWMYSMAGPDLLTIRLAEESYLGR
jgi:hypothetical protein